MTCNLNLTLAPASDSESRILPRANVTVRYKLVTTPMYFKSTQGIPYPRSFSRGYYSYLFALAKCLLGLSTRSSTDQIFDFVMSADLWKEFGSSDQELLTNPWRQPPDINLQTEKPDFEVPAALLLTQVSKSHRGSNTDASSILHACGDLNTQIKNTKSVHEPQPPGLSSLGEYGITDQASAIEKSSQPSQREIESFGVVPTTTEYSHTPGEKATPTHTDAQTLDGDDEWGDFIEGTTPESADSSAVGYRGPPRLKSSHDIQALAFSSPTFGQLHLSEEDVKIESTAMTSTVSDLEQRIGAPVQGTPPSNIPPPSILLLLISSVFQSLSSDFKKYNLQAEPSSQTSSLVDKKLITNLHRKLAVIRASARVIAGRKLRWGRDAHLSQSMKIGPAQGGRAGGMKLTVLDRTETRREDREVEEAIRTWKQQIGSLRALLAAIRTQESDHTLAIPELAEKMPIRLAKLSEGGIIAAKSCFLCGLKRDERVEKIDIGVEDSFGEWWIDHWGHVDCVTLWEEQKDYLQQR